MNISTYAIPGLRHRPEVLRNPELVKQAVLQSVCDYYNITPPEMKKFNRKREVVLTRQIACYLLKQKTAYSLKTIGSIISPDEKPRDHTTVLHSITVINNLLDTDESFREDLEKIQQMVTENMYK